MLEILGHFQGLNFHLGSIFSQWKLVLVCFVVCSWDLLGWQDFWAEGIQALAVS